MTLAIPDDSLNSLTPSVMTLHGNGLVADLKRRFVTVNDDVRAGGHLINVIRPRSAEDLISEEDFERDERLPYWAELWPSSTILANFVLELQTPPAHGIELGCGVGLVSIAATIAGHTMLATDYYQDALEFTKANSYRSGGKTISTLLLDWRDIPDTLGTFDLVLASDVLYESSYSGIVSQAIHRMLSPTGVAYIADPGRMAIEAFIEACATLGLRVTRKVSRPYQAGKVRQTISIYEIRR